MHSFNEVIANANTLTSELQWVSQIIDCRLKLHKNQPCTYKDVLDVPLPDINSNKSMYADIVKHYQLTFAERLILLLAIIPHLKPELLSPLLFEKWENGKIPAEIGGMVGNNHTGLIPTGQTALFLLSGNRLDYRLELMQAFGKEHYFHKYNILKLKQVHEDEPFLSGLIQISDEYFEPLVNGKVYVPMYSEKFPARSITTPMEWEDLVLPVSTMKQVEQIRTWIQYGDILMNDWGLSKRIKPGFRTLFYGPPGTGKTLTATLLGKVTNLEVFRVDLSMTVSKWIGETEKNLSNLFELAMNKNWILFFDEADALFNQRSKVQNSNDRSSNQQVAYLLQRMEDYPGIVILASNMKQNIDEAFTRRIQTMIHFPMPGPIERLKLWEENFLNKYYEIESSISLKELADKYELAGGSIINVLRYSCIKSIGRNSKKILKEDILEGIRTEFQKDGKSVEIK